MREKFRFDIRERSNAHDPGYVASPSHNPELVPGRRIRPYLGAPLFGVSRISERYMKVVRRFGVRLSRLSPIRLSRISPRPDTNSSREGVFVPALMFIFISQSVPFVRIGAEILGRISYAPACLSRSCANTEM
jgi:hypothetical protein